MKFCTLSLSRPSGLVKNVYEHIVFFKKIIRISNDDIFEPIDGRWSCPYCMYQIVNNVMVCSQ